MKDYPDKMTLEQAKLFGEDVLNYFKLLLNT